MRDIELEKEKNTCPICTYIDLQVVEYSVMKGQKIISKEGVPYNPGKYYKVTCKNCKNFWYESTENNFKTSFIRK